MQLSCRINVTTQTPPISPGGRKSIKTRGLGASESQTLGIAWCETHAMAQPFPGCERRGPRRRQPRAQPTLRPGRSLSTPPRASSPGTAQTSTGKCFPVPAAGFWTGTVRETDTLLEAEALATGRRATCPGPDARDPPGPRGAPGEATAAPAASLGGWRRFPDGRAEPENADGGDPMERRPAPAPGSRRTSQGWWQRIRRAVARKTQGCQEPRDLR